MRALSFSLVAGLLAVSSAPRSVSAASAAELRLNGWYPCTYSTSLGGTNSSVTPFECAEVDMPLCHEGVCESDKTISLFVRRLRATEKAKERKALWFLQGGPGVSSFVLEYDMTSMNELFEGAVDLYTVDHRGTGRSMFLECQAAQAFASGSPGGIGLEYNELPNCVSDILFQIDNHTEAFSVTSAAKDIVHLVENLYDDDVDTFIYGVSYGTYWSSRIMHLAPKKVKGYILDGVVDESSPTFTTINSKRAQPEERFLKLCENDKYCSSKLKDEIKEFGSLKKAWKAIFEDLDSATTKRKRCADLLRKTFPDAKPSYGLRNYLSSMVGLVDQRLLIPAIMHRLYYCEEQDVKFLTFSVFGDPDAAIADPTPAPAVYDQVQGSSIFLGQLIKASEMWTHPSPSWQSAMKDFEAGIFSSNSSQDFATYCFFTADFNDPACSELVKLHTPEIDFMTFKTPKFIYTPEKVYWKKPAKIPDHASALLFNGELDFLTTSEWGTNEYENLEGDKMVVNFSFGAHGSGFRPSTFSDRTSCGYNIVAWYVSSGGDVGKVNTDCMQSLPPFSFTDVRAIQQVFPNIMNADALYDS